MKTKKVIIAMLVMVLISVMSGCVYSSNKSWEDLTEKEQQEVKEELDNVREELKEDFPEDTKNFVDAILDKVEEGIEG